MPNAIAPAAPSPNAKPLEGVIAPAPELKVPATYSEADVEGLPGGERLIGAEIGEGVDDFRPVADFTDPNAEPESEASAELAAEAVEGEVTEEATEAGAEGEAEAIPELPEAARTQIETLSHERDELKARLEEAQTLLAAPNAPSGNGPLVKVSEASALRAHEEFAESIEAWADENREGGEVPKHLQAALQGRNIEDLDDPLVLDKQEAFALLKNAREMLRKHIPARREFLETEKSNEAWVRENYPQYFDPAKPEGQFFMQFQREVPGMKSNPKWPAALACLVRGHMEILKELQQAAAKKTAGPAQASAPPAPISPTTGAARGGARPTIAKPDRGPKLRPGMSQDEIMAMM